MQIERVPEAFRPIKIIITLENPMDVQTLREVVSGVGSAYGIERTHPTNAARVLLRENIISCISLGGK